MRRALHDYPKAEPIAFSWIAFTALPIEAAGRAPRWDDDTLMEGSDPVSRVPSSQRLSSTYRLELFVYEYRATDDDGHGAFIARSERASAVHAEASGLATLAHPQD